MPTWLPDWTSGQQGEIPIAGIWLLLAIAVGWVILRRTPFGIHLQALGGSESASRSAGIHVTRVRILAYVAAGICSALAGIVLAGLTQSGDPTIGAVYLLDAIAAVVIGGTSLAGGVGSISGTILGAVALSLLSAVLARQRHLHQLPVHRDRRDRDRRAARPLDAVEARGACGQTRALRSGRGGG